MLPICRSGGTEERESVYTLMVPVFMLLSKVHWSKLLEKIPSWWACTVLWTKSVTALTPGGGKS